MKSFFSFRPMAACLVAAALAGAAGCSSGPDARATVDSMGTFGIETAKAKDAIDTTVKALETLVGAQAGDIKTSLDAYSKSLTTLEEQAKVVRKHAGEMKASGDAFFKEWETDASASVSQERRAELSASYAKIKEDMAQAGDTFTPFLASLKDIQSYLSLDPSLKGVNSVAPLVKQAKDSGSQVKSRVESVLLQVNSVRGVLSTKAAK
jgi:hypothetical protein